MKLPSIPPYLPKLYYDVADFWDNFELPRRRTWADASPAGMKLSANLITEEFNEYLNAEDKVTRLDGLVDLAYVLFGAAHAIGMPIQIVQSKVNYETRTLAGNIASIVHEFPRGISCCFRLMDECLPAAITQTCWAGEEISTSFHKAWNVVHNANMGKLWKEPTDDEELLFKKVPAGWLCRRLSDGKIVKPPNFTHPDLSKFVKS